MGDENLFKMQQTADAETIMTNGAVHEDASNGPASKMKIDDVTEVPSADVEGKEASGIVAESGKGTPTQTQGEVLAVSVMSTEVGEDVTGKTKASHRDEAERESEVKDENGTENGNGMKHIAEKTGEEKGKETEAVETQGIDVEENGGKQPETDPSSEEKPEILEDNALNVSPPPPKRHKSEARSVAGKAARNEKIPGRPPCDPERVEVLKKMTTVEDMTKLVAEYGRSEADYKIGDIVKVDDLMQTKYEYKLEAPVGKKFADGFSPAFTPQQMLAYGIFEGKVINDCFFEFPKEWYEEALEKGKLSPEGPDDSKNYFNVKSRLPGKQWRKRGWFPKEDPHGWFQWYCRYYLGRRLEPDDTHQISRWRQLRRHAGQIKKNCQPGDLSSRVKQRQTLLNWGILAVKTREELDIPPIAHTLPVKFQNTNNLPNTASTTEQTSG